MPRYVRITEAPDLTVKRPCYVYESRVDCPLYSEYPEFGDDIKVVTCQLTTNVNESQLWCPDCGECNIWTALFKSFQGQGTNFATIWQDTDTLNLTTGRVETDEKKMAIHLRERSEIDGERLGMKVDYQIVDPTDKDALGVTDEGLDATHDHQVRTGQKDSRGRFVW